MTDENELSQLQTLTFKLVQTAVARDGMPDGWEGSKDLVDACKQLAEYVIAIDE